MEIRILSCMGRVYSDLLQLVEARFYLEKAYDAMHALPPERLSTALTKIYYNYAVFLKEQQEDCLALKVTNEGISLAREKNSLYFLEELFELKGHLLYRLKEEKQPKKSFQLYRAVMDIRQSDKVV